MDKQDDTERYASDKLLADIYGVSRATIWRWAANGTLPQPVKLSPGTTRWRLADVQAHMASVA